MVVQCLQLKSSSLAKPHILKAQPYISPFLTSPHRLLRGPSFSVKNSPIWPFNPNLQLIHIINSRCLTLTKPRHGSRNPLSSSRPDPPPYVLFPAPYLYLISLSPNRKALLTLRRHVSQQNIPFSTPPNPRNPHRANQSPAPKPTQKTPPQLLQQHRHQHPSLFARPSH